MRRDPPRGKGRDRARAAEAQRRLRVPALRRLQAHDGPGQRRVRAEGAQAPEGEIAERVDELLNLVQLQASAIAIRAALRRAAPAHGSRRALAPEPQVLLLDEPFGALDARVRAELREWLRQLHDVVHVTTVFVTHDQDEAMEISDQIAVINHGRLEQVGGPRELYDEPASEFVMTFVGDAQPLGDVLVRPHDIELLHEPADASRR